MPRCGDVGKLLVALGRGKIIRLRGGEKIGVSLVVDRNMGGFEPPILSLCGMGSLAAPGSASEGDQGTVFLSIEGDLAGLVSLGLDDLD